MFAPLLAWWGIIQGGITKALAVGRAVTGLRRQSQLSLQRVPICDTLAKLSILTASHY